MNRKIITLANALLLKEKQMKCIIEEIEDKGVLIDADTPHVSGCLPDTMRKRWRNEILRYAKKELAKIQRGIRAL